MYFLILTPLLVAFYHIIGKENKNKIKSSSEDQTVFILPVSPVFFQQIQYLIGAEFVPPKFNPSISECKIWK